MEALAPPDIEVLLDLLVILTRVSVEQPERLLLALMEQLQRLVPCDGVAITVLETPMIRGGVVRGHVRPVPADPAAPRPVTVPVHELRLAVPVTPEQSLRISCYRRSHDFDGREETALGLLAEPLHRLLAPALGPTGREAEALTQREREVLLLAARGRTNKEIGRDLFLAPDTVRKHLEHVYEKLGVHNRTEASALLRGTNLHGGATRT